MNDEPDIITLTKALLKALDEPLSGIWREDAGGPGSALLLGWYIQTCSGNTHDLRQENQ